MDKNNNNYLVLKISAALIGVPLFGIELDHTFDKEIHNNESGQGVLVYNSFQSLTNTNYVK